MYYIYCTEDAGFRLPSICTRQLVARSLMNAAASQLWGISFRYWIVNHPTKLLAASAHNQRGRKHSTLFHNMFKASTWPHSTAPAYQGEAEDSVLLITIRTHVKRLKQYRTRRDHVSPILHSGTPGLPSVQLDWIQYLHNSIRSVLAHNVRHTLLPAGRKMFIFIILRCLRGER